MAELSELEKAIRAEVHNVLADRAEHDLNFTIRKVRGEVKKDIRSYVDYAVGELSPDHGINRIRALEKQVHLLQESINTATNRLNGHHIRIDANRDAIKFINEACADTHLPENDFPPARHGDIWTGREKRKLEEEVIDFLVKTGEKHERTPRAIACMMKHTGIVRKVGE